MTEDAPLRKTALHDVHAAAGARLVPFAGWEMPVQYTGVMDEHVAVRTRAGLFDVSHMGEARVRGRDALAFLQHVTCNDVAKLVPGKIQYSGLTTPEAWQVRLDSIEPDVAESIRIATRTGHFAEASR